MKLDGRACLITGAATGIGYAIASDAVAEGARVLIADVKR
jgi:NAD(P)-dependent dehydrogenase (short-subunit alcohol dehydrogenase family)